METPGHKIRIAIIGGGIGGASLANALMRIPRIHIDVFEAGPTFSERGAAIGLSTNAILALQHILPNKDDARKLLAAAGGVPMNSTRIVLGCGPQAGTMVADMVSAPEDRGIVVHRGSLLRELLAPIPRDLLHANKKLVKLEELVGVDGREEVKVTFEDGTSTTFDAVMGADGVFSIVRNFVLQDQQPEEHAASPGGFWDCRILVPYHTARDTIGAEHFEDDRQYAWVGDGAFIMHDILEDRTMVQCVISAVEDRVAEGLPDGCRKRPLTREFLKKTLRTWWGGPIAKGAIEKSDTDLDIQLMLNQPNPQAYSQFEHKSTPTYYRNNTCIVGDAAHATTPWQGAGAGQALEDAMILGALFTEISSADQVNAVFRVFDTVRRQRCQRVIDSSRGTGSAFCGQGPELAALEPDGFRGRLKGRWDFIFELDFGRYIQDAKEKLGAELARSN
ncbi:hypothetical protein V8F20_011682 [Naviculisporaceae sp. PSN 640]